MIQTSYFAKSAKNPNAVSISLRSPWWYKGRKYPALAPPADLLSMMSTGEIDEDQYKLGYYQKVLYKLDPIKVASDLGPDAILLCWEGPNKLCHRHLVAAWLGRRLGVEIKELV